MSFLNRKQPKEKVQHLYIIAYRIYVDCPLHVYENIRVEFFYKVIDLCPNFRYMAHHQNLSGYLPMNMNNLKKNR
jgi:hypothetical protein